MNMKRKVIIAGATALVLTAGASVATAAVISGGPVDSSGVIHGCYTNRALKGSHVFVLQDAGTSCPRGTTAVSWNEQGPAGTSGIDGGVVTFTQSGSGNTCTMTQSFGPDAVTVAATSLQFAGGGVYPGCEVSGFPANADVQATPLDVEDGDYTTLALYPQTPSSTDAIIAGIGSGEGSGEFSWLAVPSS